MMFEFDEIFMEFLNGAKEIKIPDIKYAKIFIQSATKGL